MLNEKELALLGDKYIEQFKALNHLMIVKKEAEKEEKRIKAEIEAAFTKYGIDKFSNDYITMTYVKPSESKSIDIDALKNQEPKLWDELMEDYPKVTKRKGYIKFTVPKNA